MIIVLDSNAEFYTLILSQISLARLKEKKRRRKKGGEDPENQVTT